jgi:AcrR family transcriptional regulator
MSITPEIDAATEPVPPAIGQPHGFCPFGPPPPSGLSDIAQKRRDQIMDAAEAIIAGEGIHKLSLGRIEERLGGMSRGQLTYYFPNKESILLAVYERMLRRMIAEALSGEGPKPMTGRALDCMMHALAKHLSRGGTTEKEQDLFSLLYTFLAQMSHREDYRKRLSEMYSGWRAHLVEDIAATVPEPRPLSPHITACLFQAIIHGLTMQLAVDPEAFDRDEMIAACGQLLAPLFAGTNKIHHRATKRTEKDQQGT